jgi:PhnB protein
MPESPRMDWLERALAHAPRPEFRLRLRADLERTIAMSVTAESPTRRPSARVRQTATPQLRIRGAAAAIDFYTRAFGARELMRFEAGGRIAHAELQIGESMFFIGEEALDYGFPSPEELGGSPVAMQLLVDDADAAVERAVAAGARIVTPVADQFYGDRSGRVADPFGYTWTMAQRVEEISVEEMHRRMAALGGPGAAPGPRVAREGFRTVTPYLVSPDAPALIDFVARVFDAEERGRTVGSAAGLHAEVRIGDSMVMIGGGGPGLSWRGDAMPTSFHVYVPDTDAVFARAVEAGATVLGEPAEMEYGERSAGVKDAAGNCWYIATAHGTNYIPKDLHSVNVFLHPHRADPVLAFLSRAFGAETLSKYATPDGIIHHAMARIGDGVIEMGEAHGPNQPMATMFYLYLPNVDAAYARATMAGATSIRPPADQPYGERVAAVKDPFGNQWYLATPIEPRHN